MRLSWILVLFLAPLPGYAQAEASLGTSPRLNTQTFRCRQASDLLVSSLPGFLQIYSAGDPLLESLHLPAREIASVSVRKDGVQVNFNPRHVADGTGLLETIVIVPLDVEPPGKVLDLIRTAIDRGGPSR